MGCFFFFFFNDEIKFEPMNICVVIEHTNNVRYLYDDNVVVVRKDVSVWDVSLGVGMCSFLCLIIGL